MLSIITFIRKSQNIIILTKNIHCTKCVMKRKQLQKNSNIYGKKLNHKRQIYTSMSQNVTTSNHTGGSVL